MSEVLLALLESGSIAQDTSAVVKVGRSAWVGDERRKRASRAFISVSTGIYDRVLNC